MRFHKPATKTPTRVQGVKKIVLFGEQQFGPIEKFGRKSSFSKWTEDTAALDDNTSVAPLPAPPAPVDTSPGGDDAPD